MVWCSKCRSNLLKLILKKFSKSKSTIKQGSPGPGTDRSESVQDFQNCVGPGPVRDLEIFLGPGPSWSVISKIFSVLIRTGPRFLIFFRSWSGPVLVRSGTNRFWSVDPCSWASSAISFNLYIQVQCYSNSRRWKSTCTLHKPKYSRRLLFVQEQSDHFQNSSIKSKRFHITKNFKFSNFDTGL